MRAISAAIVVAGLVWGGWIASVASDTPSELSRLHWLEGTWERPSRGGVIRETWRVVSDRTLEGESHAVAAATGERRLIETILLAEMVGDVFFIPRPRENPVPVAFRLVELDADRAVFENPAHDFPKRIVYRRAAPDVLIAVVEGPGDPAGVAEPKRIEFRFERAGR